MKEVTELPAETTDRSNLDVVGLAREATRRIEAAGIAVDDGRVTSDVDVRTVRFYASLGLVDRPVAYVDRRARYGRRHLLQVVAVKRLQASGLSLAEVQARLAGASDDLLAELARGPVPPDAVVSRSSGPEPEPVFWQRRARRAIAPRIDAASTAPTSAKAGVLREVRVEIGRGIFLVVDLDRWPAATDPAVATRLATSAILTAHRTQLQE